MEPKGDQPPLHYGPVAAFFVGIGTFFGSQLLSGILVGLVAALFFGWSGDQTTSWLEGGGIQSQVILIGIGSAITVLLLHLFLRRRGDSLKSIGLRDFKPSAVGYAIAGFLVYLFTYIVTVTIVKAAIPALNLEQEQDLGIEIGAATSLPLLILSLVIIPPLVEEIVMRGFLFGGLRTKFSFWPSTIVTSLLFAAAHLPGGVGGLLWVGAIDTFVLSVVLCHLRERTGSLWPCILVHAMKNSLALLYLINMR